MRVKFRIDTGMRVKFRIDTGMRVKFRIDTGDDRRISLEEFTAPNMKETIEKVELHTYIKKYTVL